MRALPFTMALFASLTLGCFLFNGDGIAPRPDTFFVDDFIDTGRRESELDDTSGLPEVVWTRFEYNFDELGADVIDTTYPEMSFTADSEQHMVVYPATSLARSQPNCIYVASSAGGAGSNAAFTLTFARPVRGLRFFASGDTDAGTVAGLTLTLESDEVVELPLVTDGDVASAELVDLSSYEGVVSVRVHDVTDPNGLAYDDMSFEMREP